MALELFTIGHSNHPIETFVGLAAMHVIETVCDVRSTPYSRYNPQFNREPLSRRLAERGIAYVHLGDDLGPRTDDPACIVEGQVRYDLLAATERFRQGLDCLREIMVARRTALLCAEKDPLFCHRAILICRRLRSKDLRIAHILGDGSIEEHPDAERRLLGLLGIPPTDLFEKEEEIIERAYDLQGDLISPRSAGEQPSEENAGPDDRGPDDLRTLPIGEEEPLNGL
jgi:uncharacterized protein (DUF488 family)